MDIILPSNLDAEKGILSSMLQSDEVKRKCIACVDPGMFSYPGNCLLFRALQQLGDQPSDFVLVCNELGSKGLEELGGKESLNELYSFIPTPSNWEYYYKILKDLHYRRLAILKSRQIIDLACDDSSELSQIESVAMSLLGTSSAEGLTGADKLAADFSQWIEDLNSGQIEDRGMPWACDGLPEVIDKLRPGELCLVGGRPGSGKTSLLNSQVALTCIPSSMSTVIFSLEMTRREQVMRLVSILARIPLRHLKNKGMLSQSESLKYAEAVNLLSKSRISVCDEILNIFEIYERATAFKQSSGSLDFVGIDYAQIVRIKQSDERRIGLDTIGRVCKYMAKELDCSVMLLTQLNADGSPFESSALEAHCDQFIEIRKSMPGDRYKKMEVRKQRNGPIGTVQVSWYEDCACLYKN